MAESCPIYLDNAATSWPKAPGVVDAVAASLTACTGNPGRGVHAPGLAASRLIFEARRDLAVFLGVADSRDLAFMAGCTQATNLMLKGVLRPGDRVLVSSMEHNAVSRPLAVMAACGVDVSVVQADAAGHVDPVRVEAALREAPARAVVCQHASNLTGSIQPIAEIGAVAHAAGALMLVDGAQGAGHLDLDLRSMAVDAYAVSGHKALLGPQGIGALYLAPGLDAGELIQGGTGGGSSEADLQPANRPDRYEAGTPNTPGIAGLAAAVRFLAGNAGAVRAEESRLARLLAEGLAAVPGMRLLGPAADGARVPVVTVVHERIPADRIAAALDRDHGIAVRAGLHCAPWAHRTLGTADCGAVRFGVGFGNTDADIEAAVGAVREIVGAA